MTPSHVNPIGHTSSHLRNGDAGGQCAGWGMGQVVGCDMATLDTQREVDGVRVMRLSGSLTQHGVQDMEPELERALPDGSRAVVDLGQVDLITTPGIALILSATQRLRRTGGRVVFTAARPTVLNLLHRCRLDEVLELESGEDAALARAKN